MKVCEFKLRVVQGLNNLIDDYFGSNSVHDKFINSTLKILVKQNTYKVDQVLGIFADANGEIDEAMVIEEYSKILGENGFIFDIREYIGNDIIKGMIPDKALIIKKDDLKRMFEM